MVMAVEELRFYLSIILLPTEVCTSTRRPVTGWPCRISMTGLIAGAVW